MGSGTYLYAINLEGTLKWKFQTGGGVFTSPAIGSDGTVYVGSYDTYLYALKSDGTLKWKFQTGSSVYSSPAIGSDGTVYVGSNDGYLYAFAPEIASITVSAPNGGESWTAGTTQTIKWTSTIVTNVKIEYSTDSGTTWTTIIASTAALAGSYAWSIPATLNSTICKVRVTDAANTSITAVSAMFTIVQPVKITITAPNGGETWTAGTTQNITWTSAGIANVKIEYTTDGKNWLVITPSANATAGSYAWTIPTGLNSTNCKIRISDSANAALSDISDRVFSITPSSGGIADSAWPMFHQNPQHSGRGIGTIPASNQVKWKFQTGKRVFSSPAIGSDGTVYVGSGDCYLYAVTSDGNLKWKFQTGYGYDMSSSPAVSVDGTVYVGSDDGCLYAVTSNGNLKWKFQTTGGIYYSSPVIGTDGTVYVGSADNYLYAISLDGNLKWKFQTGDVVYSSPSLSVDGTVYVGSYDNYLYAITSTGNLKWKFQTGGDVISSPAVDADGTIYIGSQDYYIYAVTSTGNLKWKFPTSYGYGIHSSPVVSVDGTVYVGSYDGYLYAVTSNGNLKWKFHIGSSIDSSPAIGADGTIYVGDISDYLYAITSNGNLKWKFQTGDDIFSSPAIGSDGTVYVGSFDTYLYAMSPYTSPIVTARFPSTGATEVLVSQPVIVRLSEPADSSSVNSSSFQITGSISGIISGVVTIHGDSIVFTPSKNYNLGETISAVLDSTVRGKDSGLSIGRKTTWSFTISTIKGGLADSAWPMRGQNLQHTGRGIASVAASSMVKWKFQTGGGVSSPAIGADGTVYLRSSDTYLYALNPDGNMKWKYKIDRGESSPAIGSDGTIYVGSSRTIP